MNRLALVLIGSCLVATPSTGTGLDDLRSFTLATEATPQGAKRQGPNSIRVGAAGDVFVSDPARKSIRRFTPAGVLARTIELAKADGVESCATIADFALGATDDLFVLIVASRGVGLLGAAQGSINSGPGAAACPGSILHVRADGTARTLASIPAKGTLPRLLDRIERDARGNLLVHDAFDNGVLRFDPAGKMSDCGQFEGYPELALDRTGGLLGVTREKQSGSRIVTVMRMDLQSRAATPVTRLELPGSPTVANLIGQDDSGRSYVEVAFGANENPTEREVWVVGSDGAVVARLPVPAQPWEFSMNRARALIPGGGLLTAKAVDTGTVMEPHRVSAPVRRP